MHFDGTVSLGTIIGVGTLIVSIMVTYHKATTWVGELISDLKHTMANHTAQLADHSERMNRYESRFIKMAEDLQRLIGAEDANARARRYREGPDR